MIKFIFLSLVSFLCFSCKKQDEQPTQNTKKELILFEANASSNPEQWQLFTININGTDETQLTNFSNASNYVYTGNASWSPDGKKIVFTTNKDDLNGGGEIYVMNADGSDITRLTNNLRGEQNPKWK